MTDLVAVLKQPSGALSQRSAAEQMEMLATFCRAIGVTPEAFMRALEGYEDLSAKCRALEAKLSGESTCKCDTLRTELDARCDNIWAAARRACCPGNILYSQITLDEYSDNRHVPIDQIVQNFGAGYVNSFPVPVNSAIRLEQASRPGYMPDEIRIDFALANAGNNYLDMELRFFLGPGGTTKGKQIGPTWTGNEFLNKDGTQIHVEMPKYRGKIVEVGSVEKMAIEIVNTGGGNALTSANVRLPYDEAKWYANCASPDGC